MKQLFAALFMVLLFESAFAQKPNPTALLQRAHVLSSLVDDNAPPYRMIANVKVTRGGEVYKGLIRRDYLGRNRYRSRFEFGSDFVMKVRNGNDSWRSGNIEHELPIMDELWAALLPPIPSPTPKMELKATEEKTEAGVLRCVRLVPYSGKLCFDDNGLLARSEDYLSRTLYSEYTAFGAKSIARHVSITLRDGRKAEIELELQDGSDLRPEMFVPPATLQMSKETVCETREIPRPLRTPDPKWPSTRQQVEQAVVVLKAWISADGKVEHLEAARAPGADLLSAARDTVMNWTFEPGKCEGKPTAQDIYLEVNFRRNDSSPKEPAPCDQDYWGETGTANPCELICGDVTGRPESSSCRASNTRAVGESAVRILGKPGE